MTDQTTTATNQGPYSAARPDLAALLGSRICHDLISPIGAIGNGVELLQMDGGSAGPEMALIAESVSNANARIRYFRIGFGASSADQRIGRAEVTGILSDLTRGGRLDIEWNTPTDLARSETKLAFLLLMCIETALAWGGRVTVEGSEGAWQITATAARLRMDPALWAVLSDPAARYDITPALVHFALIPDELARLGRRLICEMTDTSINLRF